MDDRRRESRKKLMAFTPAYASGPGTLLGYVGNLNFLGTLVVSERPLKVNTRETLLIKFPSALTGILTTQLLIQARVVRCEQDESPQDYMIGFEFVEVTPEQTKIIQALLDRYYFQYQNNTFSEP